MVVKNTQHIHARIQECSSGGGGSRSVWQKSSDNVLTFFFFFFLVLSLFYRNQMVNFKKSIIFKVPEGGLILSRGSNFFQGGGGSNCLFPIETHITCDFPGGSDPLPPPPPLDPHLTSNRASNSWWSGSVLGKANPRSVEMCCDLVNLPLSIITKMVFKTVTRFMQVKSIAECSEWMEPSAILSTCARLPAIIKTFVLYIFEWPFYAGFTVQMYSRIS